MSRLSSVLQNPDHRAFIPYLTSGYPDFETSLHAVEILIKGGADIIELGIPFSDPMADGVTIQDSSYQALLKGMNTPRCLELARRIRQKSDMPLVFMTYFNPGSRYGLEAFCRDSSAAGIDGLIVPDLPPEEALELDHFAVQYGLDMIYLLAPTSTPARLKLVAERSRGYIYLVSVAGVTGARQNIPSCLPEFVTRVRQVAGQPLCVGFGISTPQQAAEVARLADGVIIGSRLIQLIKEDPTLAAFKQFTDEVRRSLE